MCREPDLPDGGRPVRQRSWRGGGGARGGDPRRGDAAAAPAPAEHDNQQSIRINKCFREFASRRESDRFVEEGRVSINGAVALPGARVQAGDKVCLDDEPVTWEHLNLLHGAEAADTGQLEAEARFVYLKYWKPRGVVCTTDRSIEGNIVDAVDHPERIFMVGRLDKDSTGLILLTSDGRVPNSVLRSKEQHQKVYQVTARRDLSERDLQDLRDGVIITTVAQRDGNAKALVAKTLPCQVERGPRRNLAEITLQEGRNRQIRKMLERAVCDNRTKVRTAFAHSPLRARGCGALSPWPPLGCWGHLAAAVVAAAQAIGNRVEELHRISVMGIGLGDLRPGEWAYLSEQEMEDVRRAVAQAERGGGGNDEGGEAPRRALPRERERTVRPAPPRRGAPRSQR